MTPAKRVIDCVRWPCSPVFKAAGLRLLHLVQVRWCLDVMHCQYKWRYRQISRRSWGRMAGGYMRQDEPDVGSEWTVSQAVSSIRRSSEQQWHKIGRCCCYLEVWNEAAADVVGTTQSGWSGCRHSIETCKETSMKSSTGAACNVPM